ncbi:putative reverse transcriptase [Ilyonectria robusta]
MAFAPVAPIPIDLGLRNPLHLPQIARAALIQGSEYDISEGLIPEAIGTPTPAPGSVLLGDEALIDISMFDVIEPAELLADPLARPSPPSSDVFEHSKTSEPTIAINLSAAAAAGVALESQAILDDKMKVFRTFCTAFDETAKQFPTGPDKLGIKLDAIPQASRTKTGWAIRPANLDIRNKIINEEACWAPALGATAVELATKWITYAVPECPRTLTDLLGKTVDYEAALKDEVEAQTGLRAVSCRPSRLDDPTQPTKTLLISFLEQPKHAFRLFGTSRLARLIRKTAKPNQSISNIPTAQARVEDHLATSSDNYTLSIILPIARPSPPQSSRIRVSDPEDLARLAEVVSLGRDFLTTTATTAEELDIAAAQLLDLLQDAIRIVGRCPQQNGRSAPWWTKDCAKAHAQYQAAKRRDPEELGPALLARDDFPRGPPPDKVRLAVKACILPVLFYGAEAWYPGKIAPSLQAGRPEVSTRLEHLLERLQKVLHISIRSILPTWKTTPVAALYRESGIPPVDQLLEAIRLRQAARLQSLDPRHPLTARTVIPTPRPGQKPIYKTRLQRTALLLPPSPRPDLLQRKYSPAQLHIQPKDVAVPAFLAWIETRSVIDLIVYSDGSRSSGGAAGYGTRLRRVRRDDRGSAFLPRYLPPSPLGTLV